MSEFFDIMFKKEIEQVKREKINISRGACYCRYVVKDYSSYAHRCRDCGGWASSINIKTPHWKHPATNKIMTKEEFDEIYQGGLVL